MATLEEGAGKLLAGAPRACVWLPDAEGRLAGDDAGVPELVRQALQHQPVADRGGLEPRLFPRFVQ